MRGILSSFYYAFPSLRALMFLVPPLYGFRRKAAFKLLQIVMGLRPRTLLEVGFSDAFLTKRLALALPHTRITAIDTSEKAVVKARRLSLPNVVFLKDDFFNHRGYYDVVVSMHVFVLFNHREALKKLRTLAPLHVITLTGVSPFTRLHRPFHLFMTGMDVGIVEPRDYTRIAAQEGFNAEIHPLDPLERSYAVVLTPRVPAPSPSS